VLSLSLLKRTTSSCKLGSFKFIIPFQSGVKVAFTPHIYNHSWLGHLPLHFIELHEPGVAQAT